MVSATAIRIATRLLSAFVNPATFGNAPLCNLPEILWFRAVALVRLYQLRLNNLAVQNWTLFPHTGDYLATRRF